MSDNPFESPRVVQTSGEAPTEIQLAAERSLASKQFTFMVLILAVPAIANLLLFNYFVTGTVRPLGLFYLMATLNAIGVAVVIFALLFGGMAGLEWLTRLTNRMFGRQPQLGRWYEELYAVLKQAWFLTIPAAVLWAFWLLMFYGTDVPFLVFTVPIGILAHLMAASLYSRLLWRWYKIPEHA